MNLPKQIATVLYQPTVLENGRAVSCRPFKRNLILDGGLDQVAARHWKDCFTHAAAGTGTTPNTRDSGAVTFERAGSTVTASAGFFTAADVGRLLKFDTGEEIYLQSYTSPTSMESASSGAIAAAPGTIHYVNQTALAAEVERTNTYRTEVGDNSSTYDAALNRWIHQRTFLFPIRASAITYTEYGWSWGAGATALFGRDVPTVGTAVAIGQQLMLTVQLIVTYSPMAAVAVGNVADGGWDSSGDAVIEYISTAGGFGAVGTLNTNGASSGNIGALEPGEGNAFQVEVKAFNANWSLSPEGLATTPANQPAGSSVLVTRDAYVAGSRRRKVWGLLGIAQANGTVYGVGLTVNSQYRYRVFSQKFTTPQTKDAEHQLRIEFEFAWDRTPLVN